MLALPRPASLFSKTVSGIAKLLLWSEIAMPMRFVPKSIPRYFIPSFYIRIHDIAFPKLWSMIGSMDTITLNISPWIMALAIAWSIPWKGVALWKAARLGSKWWFIALLVLNTLAVLDIIFIYFVARKYTVETMEKSEVHS